MLAFIRDGNCVESIRPYAKEGESKLRSGDSRAQGSEDATLLRKRCYAAQWRSLVYFHCPRLTHLAILIAGLVGMSVTLAQSRLTERNKISVLLPDNTQAALPLETGILVFHRKAAGLAGVSSYTEISGRQATVRLHTGQPQTFVMSLEPNSELIAANEAVLAGMAALHKLDVDKKSGKRRLVSIDVTGYGPFNKQRTADYRGIPLNFSHDDARSVRIEPRSPLPPGEYAFGPLTSTGSSDPYGPTNQFYFYCFAVD
jgi:hypothetical protein